MAAYPHFEDPQLVQIRHPSWYVRLADPQSWHFCLVLALVPSGMYFFNARSTPAFQVLMDSLSSLRDETRLTTSGIGIP
jgi:hypothetical protein